MTQAEFHEWWKRLYDGCGGSLPEDKVVGRQKIFWERLQHIPKARAWEALAWYFDHAEDDFFPVWRRIQDALDRSRVPGDYDDGVTQAERERLQRETAAWAEEMEQRLRETADAKGMPE